MTHLLLLDNSTNLINSLDKICQSAHILLDKVNQEEEAKRKIEQEDYQGIIIRETYAKEYLAFIQWIRAESKKNLFIALLSPVFDQLEDYQALKQNDKIEYILPPFPSYSYLVGLISNFDMDHSAGKNEDIRKTLPPALQNKYRASLYPKFQSLEALFKTIRNDPSHIDPLSELRLEVHKITGSAGTYGYLETSRICRKCEERVQAFLAQEKKDKIPEDLICYLQQFLIDLRLYFQHVIPKEDKDAKPALTSETLDADSSPSSVKPPLLSSAKSAEASQAVILAIQGSAILYLFKKKCMEMFIKTEVEPNPDKVLERLKTEDIHYFCLIAEESYAKGKINGYQLIEQVRKEAKYPPRQFGIILKQNTIDNWMKAIGAEIDYIFKPNLTEENIRDVLEAINAAIKKA
ncbi:Hpt domain-containing protein [Candidatus Protochlamydia phocaeensis]|uniref:Hpt domain-containing protein n=1 Tax=Candidatus Protochlamydia phocaeensis TaxID=1414722 RepID=UPI00083909D3|nr:Hpt domain-containing protein [Candidatus Protochlamydia phocaeensis]